MCRSKVDNTCDGRPLVYHVIVKLCLYTAPFRRANHSAMLLYCTEFVGAARRDDMTPANGSLTRGGSTPVRGRVRSPRMAKLQAIAYSLWGSCAPRAGTDRRTDRGIA